MESKTHNWLHSGPVAVQEVTDEQLIAAFQRGQEEAFSLLVNRYKHPLMNFVYRFLGDYDEADDVVQETFLRVHRNRDAYKQVAKFSTWLYTIAGNLAKTALRRRTRHQFFSLTDRWRKHDDKDYDIPDTRHLPDQQADGALLHERVQEALGKLKPKYREVVLLFELQELSYEEICQITHLNIGTVKSRLNRGRAQLKLLLRDLLDE